LARLNQLTHLRSSAVGVNGWAGQPPA
jgi:hypothetical protein